MTFVKPVPYDISHASTSNLAQAGLDHRAQTASCLHLTVSCLRALADSMEAPTAFKVSSAREWPLQESNLSHWETRNLDVTLQLPVTGGWIWRHSACFLGGPEESQQSPQWHFSCLPACPFSLSLPSLSCLFLASSSQSTASSHHNSQRHHIVLSALKN